MDRVIAVGVKYKLPLCIIYGFFQKKKFETKSKKPPLSAGAATLGRGLPTAVIEPEQLDVATC